MSSVPKERAIDNNSSKNTIIPLIEKSKIKNFLKYKKKEKSLSPNLKINDILNKTNIDNFKINNYNINNNIYTYRNKLSPFTKRIKILSTKNKNKNFSFILKKSSSPLSTNISLNYQNGNYVNQNFNLYKLWDELAILKPYRKYFNYIYKELDTEYKEELYKKEI